MRFSNSIFLLFLLTVPVLIFFFVAAWKKKRRLMEAFGSLELMEKLTMSVNVEKQRLKIILLVAAFFFMILAISGPQIGTRMVEVKRRGVDIIIAVDCSKSMQAEDVEPTRLVKAKRELSTLINELKGDRIGIIAFAGVAFLQCPLTLDYNAAKMFLDIIDTDLIQHPGTEIDKAIDLARESFSRKERKYKALILLTDGENHSKNMMASVKEAKKEGIKIFAVGIGTPDGEPIPIHDENGNITGYKKDKKGAVVMSKLDEKSLREIALKTGGGYFRSTPGGSEIENIYEEISRMDKKQLESKLASQYEDRYQYLVLLVLILLVIEFLVTEYRKEVHEV